MAMIRSVGVLLFIILMVSTSGNAGRPPRLMETPADSVVPRNEPATLNCRADGDPSPQITWIKDGKPLRADRGGLRNQLPSGSLFFLRVRKDIDAGSYACIATNAFGSVVSRNASLDVATLRDEFRASPQNTWVAQGDTVVLECEPPRGNPEPKVSWKKNGNLIDMKANGRYKIVGQGSLSISQVRQTEEGRYVCMARNIVGTRLSNTALLRVTVRPQFTIRPSNTSALLGGEVSLSCVAKGDPPPEITWIRQGGSLPLKRVHFDEERFLISNVSHVDHGVYTCVAENKAGSITSSASVTVLPLPIFTMLPTDIEIQPNSTAYFGCEAKSDPTPTLVWLKEEGHSVIFQGSRVDNMQVTPDGTLQIENVSEHDEGYYLCAAISQAGSILHRVHLKITPVEKLPPPIISSGPRNQTRVVNSVAVFPCIANGTPTPVTTWYKDGNSFLLNHRLFTDDFGTLRINDLMESDAGTYECVASSPSGKYVWRSQLEVLKKSSQMPFDPLAGSPVPSPPSKPRIVFRDSNSVTISWSHKAHIGGDESSFTDESHEFPSLSQRTSLIIGEDDNNGRENGHSDSKGVKSMKSTSPDEPSYIDDTSLDYYTDDLKSKIKSKTDRGQRRKRSHQMDQSVFAPTPNRFLSQSTAAESENDNDDDTGSNGFDDIVSQIIAQDRAKEEDEYDYNDYEDEDGASNPNEKSNLGNLIIQSSGSDFNKNQNPDVTSTTTTTVKPTLPTTIPTIAAPTAKSSSLSPPARINYLHHLSLFTPSKKFDPSSTSTPSSTPSVTYKVEYYSADEVKTEWLLGATNVPQPTFTLKHLKPNTEYVFFVRSVTSDGVISSPSELSDPVKTFHSGQNELEVAEAREKLAQGTIVILRNVYSTSSTMIKIEWQIVSATDFVEGFYVYYRRIEDPSNVDVGSYQMLTVLNADASTFQIGGLDKFATYQIFLVPFFKNVEGRPSNYVNVTTLEDVPTAPPELIEPLAVNSTALVVRWKPPPRAYHNGVILGYQLRVWQGSSLLGNKTVDGQTNSVVLNNLNSGQSYSVQVGCFTSRGIGVFSPMRTLHFRPDPQLNNNQLSNSINTYNPPNGESGSVGVKKQGKTNNNNSIKEQGEDDIGSKSGGGAVGVDNNLIPDTEDEFVTSDGIAFGGATANPHDLFSEAWFIALVGSLVFAMMLVFVFALYLRRCQLGVENDKLKVSTTEIPDGSIPPHYPDDNLWIDASQHKQHSLKSVKTSEMMNDYENANNYAVVEERHSPIAYATTTLVNNNGQKHKSNFSVFGDTGGRGEFSFGHSGGGSNKIIGGWNPLGPSNNNKTSSLNISSQDIKKPPWLMNTSPQHSAQPCSSQSSSSHSSASSEALMKLNPKQKLSLKSSANSDNSSNKNNSRRPSRTSRPSSRAQGREDEFNMGEEGDSFCLTEAQQSIMTTFQTPLLTRKHLIVDYSHSGSQQVTSSVLQQRLNGGGSERGPYEYSHYAHPGNHHHHPY